MKLHNQILLALLLGVAAGGLLGPRVQAVELVGTVFIGLIKMVVIPLIFCSIVVSIASLGDVRRLGAMGGRTVLYYLVTTCIAIVIGLSLASAIRPGEGVALSAKLHSDAARGEGAGEGGGKGGEEAEIRGFSDILVKSIPVNPVGAMARGEILPTVVFAMIFGVALIYLGERNRVLLDPLQAVSDAMIVIVHFLLKLAPYGVFALMATTVAATGMGVLLSLLKYSLTVLLALGLQMFVTYPLFLVMFARVSPLEFFKGMRDAMLFAFSTASSSATLPVTMECMQRNLRVPSRVTSFVLPLGATVNMDGTALYEAIAAIFVAQAYGFDLTLAQKVTIFITANLAAVGAAGIPGAGLVTMALVLKAVGLPLEGIGLILSVDRLLDMCRTALNVTGDGVVTMMVAKRTEVKGTASGKGS